MTQPISPPAKDKQEYDRLKLKMERGAKTTLETRRKLAGPPVELGPDEPIVVELPEAGGLAKEMGEANIEVHLVLQLRYTRTPEWAALVFLNTPQADAGTPASAPGYAGALAFFGPSDDAPAHHDAPSVRLPVTTVINQMGRPDRFTVTLVPVAYAGRRPGRHTVTVTASLEVVFSKVEPN